MITQSQINAANKKRFQNVSWGDDGEKKQPAMNAENRRFANVNWNDDKKQPAAKPAAKPVNTKNSFQNITEEERIRYNQLSGGDLPHAKPVNLVADRRKPVTTGLTDEQRNQIKEMSKFNIFNSMDAMRAKFPGAVFNRG